MRIRQIALVAADLEAALETLADVLGIEVGFRDPGVAVFGLGNGVMPVGDHFLEVVSPREADTSAGRYLERRGGDGGYMVIFQTRDLAARRGALEDAGVRIVWEIAFDDIATAHLHPRDTGGAIVSIDEARPWESWRWGGPDHRAHVRTSRVQGIAGVEIQADDPVELAARWSRLFGLEAATSTRLVTPDGARLDFVPVRDGRGEGLRSVVLHATDADAVRAAAKRRGLHVDADGAVTMLGLRFVLEG